MTNLSERDEAILASLATGATTKEIAEVVSLSHGTIRVYIPQIYRKIGVKNNVQAAVWWVRRNMKNKKKKQSMKK